MDLTREDLHRRVWSQPMPQAAHALGLTAAELQRICATLDVPFPYSGFWRRGAALDGRVRRLPRARPGHPATVTIDDPPTARGAPQPTPAAVAPEPAASEPAAGERQSKSRAPESVGTVVPAADLHPIIAARLEQERREGDTGAQPTADAPARLDRYRLVRNRLFLALEQAGHVVRTEGQSLYDIRFEVEGLAVTHAMRERYTRTKRPLTPKEARDPVNVAAGRDHAFEYRMTGRLVLAIQTERFGRKAEWCDDARRGRLEDRTPEIVAGIEAKVREAHRIDAENREREARWRRRDARRAAAEQRARREEQRWARLCQVAAWHEEARRVAAFLKRVRAQAPKAAAAEPAIAAWLDWAAAEVADRDPGAWDMDAVVRHVDDPPKPKHRSYEEEWEDEEDDDEDEDGPG